MDLRRRVELPWFIGLREKAAHFAMLCLGVEPDGWTSLGGRERDHAVMVLGGRGRVLLGDDAVGVSFADIVHISHCELPQFKNVGHKSLALLRIGPTGSPAE